jgi:Zn-dependent protease with chaperone function
MAVTASYYDGQSSDCHPVTLSHEGECLRIVGSNIDLSCASAAVRLSPPLGRLRRTLTLPEGGICEIEDAAVAQLFPSMAGRGATGLHRWERSLGLALTALLLTIAAVGLFLHYGVPVLAKQVARAIPPQSEQQLGEEALTFLDQALLGPTTLPHARREEVQALFAGMQQQLPGTSSYRLELRQGQALGANALALPAGIIVVTDEFVTLTQHDEEILAVLAHEIAHARQRHVLRSILQNSAVGVIVASLSGDLTSITSLGAALPTALVDARYSRQFENEADAAAVAYLKAQQIPVTRFADILQRLQSEHERRRGKAGSSGIPFGDLFSTHTETAARLERIGKE